MSEYTGFTAGARVRLRSDIFHACPEGRDDHETAEIDVMLPVLGEGVLLTKTDLRGCRYWSANDLELVEEAV